MLILLAISAALVTAAQYIVVRHDRGPNDYDWVYIAGGALLSGFTANVWYSASGPVVDGLYLVPALLGAVLLAAVVEVIYRSFIRPRQTA
ncbi:MAG: hypothetical protein ACXVCX_16925 [Ktedonobacterales bacterium]